MELRGKADSTITGGMYYSVFFVSALTSTLGAYFDSPPDSGYSVDNLAPHAPGGFLGEYLPDLGYQLSWEESRDPDFQYFKIYRRLDDPHFTPAPENLIHMTAGTEWLDTSGIEWRHYYKVTAVDFSGNESEPVSPVMTGIEDLEVPKQFSLHQNRPNPFNPTTTIEYDVPLAGGNVMIEVFDVGGRLVRTLVDRPDTPGRKAVVWDGRDARGQQVASGVYYCRFVAPGYERMLKMTMLK